MVEATASLPQGTLVAMCRNAARILYHSGEVHEVPGHEGGIAVGEVVLGPTGARVEIGRTRAGLTHPPHVSLGWNGVAQVLQRVENVHGAVLGTIFVACDDTAPDSAIVGRIVPVH